VNKHNVKQIAVLVDGAGRRVQLGRLIESYEPAIMASADEDEAVMAAIRAASATGRPGAADDPHAAPDWLVGRAPASPVSFGC
jgi:hypothetical protein